MQETVTIPKAEYELLKKQSKIDVELLEQFIESFKDYFKLQTPKSLKNQFEFAEMLKVKFKLGKSGNYTMPEATLKQIYSKLNDIDQKVSALLLKEEKPTVEELRAIKIGKKEFSEGKFKAWKQIKSQSK